MQRPDRPVADRAQSRSGGFVSIGIVLSLVGAMAATLLGAGAFIDAFNVQDGNVWLWSSKPGSASRINSHSGRVDMRQPLVDARGHRVRVTQNDKYLILHDLDTGRVTSVDLTRMGFTGTLNVGTTSDVSVVLSGDKAAIVDRTKGLIRGLDPVTLRTSKDVLRLPPPIAGGAYDAAGKLWVAVPSQGTVVAARADQKSVKSLVSQAVSEPGHDLGLTTLDHGALAFDRDAGRFSVVGENVDSVAVDGALSDLQAPPRTVGKLVAVTSVKDRSVVVMKLGGALKPHRFDLPAGVAPAVAVPYAGRVYVPDEKHSVVHVFSASGKRLKAVELDGAKGPLELEVREGKLFINSPDTSVARVVEPDGSAQDVNKYREDVAGGEGLNGRVMPAPNPGNDSNGDEKQGPPGPPVPVTAVAGDGKVDLSWGAAAANGAAIERYEVTWDGGSKTVHGGQSTVIDGLDNGTTYTFQVLAHNKYGDGPPALSEPVTPTDHIPATPSNVRAVVAPDEGGVKVTWTDVAGARDYVVRTLHNGVEDPTVPPTTVSGPEAIVRGLTYGEPYRFTVMARNDSGAGSKPSDPSNEVRPYAAPGAPQAPSAQGTGDRQVTVRWQPAAPNGDPITKYVVTPSTGNPVTVGGNATEAQVNGLPTGQTVSFEIRAYNSAGAGQPATTSAKVGQAPTVTITGTSGDYNSVTVNFTVNGNGMPVTGCSARIEGGGSASGNCNSLTIDSGIYPGQSYPVVVTATNDIGSGQDSASASSKALWGTVTCKNGPIGDQQTYCDPGIAVKDSPREGATTVRRIHDGGRERAVCKVRDAEGRTHTAWIYNNNKQSGWWIRLPDGGYIMHVWLNLDAGDSDTANLATLPTC